VSKQFDPDFISIKTNKMKWISVTSSVVKNELFELWDGNIKILSLVYNATLRTARIVQKDRKRMFIIEQEGFFSSKTCFKNEYGVKVGQYNGDDQHATEGVVELDSEKYYFNIEQKDHPEMSIFRAKNKLAVLKCGFTQGNLPGFLAALACIFVPAGLELGG
jgi:hypothetical protein